MFSRINNQCIIYDVPFKSLDILTAENFKKGLLNAYLSSTYCDMILNLTKVDFVDASGLEGLLFAGSLVQEANGRLSLFGLTPYVKQVLMQTRLYRFFDINKTEQESLEFIKDSEFAVMCNYQQLRTRLNAKIA